jgi:uncharacterized membrane protein YozB (DUF420 family)
MPSIDTLLAVAAVGLTWSAILAGWVWIARGNYERRHRRNLLAHRRTYIRRP